MMFDRNKFKYIVSIRGYTLKKVADEIGVNPATLYRKMNGVSDFTRSEMQLIRNLLDLSIKEADDIFFARKLA
ncbi:helix-turn-helix domain-containing protein [Pectinatus frisingensis]|uniref:helix-turn-helix domain-containing protein n=1 Tax=Pectinatus frisingensis TaxID=865 RepID=UPI0018C81604|nr:helix-turn-helix transcriptional regulator [Pectinatus frisingensis]